MMEGTIAQRRCWMKPAAGEGAAAALHGGIGAGRGRSSVGAGGLHNFRPPYPHVVHWSPHKPPQRKFWHSEEEEEGEERKKKGKREERRKKKKMSPP